MLTGHYLRQARKNKLPKEVDLLVKQCYGFLRQLDVIMTERESFDRGKKVAQLATQLEMAVDGFYLYGIKPPRSKGKQPVGEQAATGAL